MRALSLWQPWATAIAIGIKKVETRHWQTAYTGRLAIHAAKRWGPQEREFAMIEHTLGRLPKRIPLGAIVATATLMGCRRTEDVVTQVSAVERIYGNYTPGRFAWFLTDVVALDNPIPFRGGQGFFNVPDELVREPLRAGPMRRTTSGAIGQP